jgi:tetratricopeptide (TPR) repeat protein
MQERGDLAHDEKGRWEVAPKISWDAMPARVEGIIQKRMGRLDSDLLEMLTVASVEGAAFTAEVVARVLGIEEQALVRRLSSELDKRHRLVRATGIERLGTQRLSRYRFRHNLFQGYLYNSLDEVERAYRHEAVGNELEKLYSQQEEGIAGIAGQLARHFHEAGDEQRALKYYTQAGDRAVRMYAYGEARQFLQKALKLSEADDSLLEQRIELLEKLADVHGLESDSPDAIPLYQEALDLRKSVGGGDKWTSIRLHRKIGEMWNSINSIDDFLRFEAQANANLEAGMELAKAESAHPETVRLMMEVSKSALWGGPSGRTNDLDTAERSARAAVEMADQLNSPSELSAALSSLARVYGVRGLWRERLQVAQQRLNVSRAAQFDDLRENLDILIQVGEAMMGVGQYDQAIPHLLEAEALGAQLHDVQSKAWVLVIQSECWLRLDRWDEILIAEEKIKVLQQRNPLKRLGAICWLLSCSAVVHALRGQNEQARQLRHESYEIMIVVAGAEQGTEEDWIREHHY